MPVLLPSYIKKYPFAPQGRFFIFPKSKMLTHHIELLKHGMEEKQAYFNLLSKSSFFSTPIKYSKLKLLQIKLMFAIQYLFVRRTWYSRRSHLNQL